MKIKFLLILHALFFVETSFAEITADRTYAQNPGYLAVCEAISNRSLDPNQLSYLPKLPSIELGKFLLANNVQPMNASLFLSLVLDHYITSDMPQDPPISHADPMIEHKECNPQYIHEMKLRYELVMLALEKGGNPNTRVSFSSALFNDSVAPDVFEKLFKNNHKIIDAKTVNSFITHTKNMFGNDLLSVQELYHKKYHWLNAPKSDSLKIPRILHHIWLTSERHPRELSQKNLDNILNSHQIFLRSGQAWEHLVWTNDRSLIPLSVSYLESHGVKVKAIDELLPYLKLGKNLRELISTEEWGMASDSLRYELLNLYGGVYADVNYIFARDLEEEIFKYDFVGQQSQCATFIENFFFMAKPNHPIFSRAIDLVYNNLANFAEYTQHLNGSSITDAVTLAPAIQAYFSMSNHETRDVVYPYISYNEATNLIFSAYPNELENFERKIGIIKQYLMDTVDIQYLEKIQALHNIVKYEICGTKQHFIGEDLNGDGARTWVKEA